MERVLRAKSFQFAVRITKLTTFLKKSHQAYELASQVFRSGTAIGALIREAECAESRKDFIHKINIALKESNETEYWLELSAADYFITKKMFDSLFNDNKELLKMLAATLRTSRSRLNKNEKPPPKKTSEL